MCTFNVKMSAILCTQLFYANKRQMTEDATLLYIKDVIFSTLVDLYRDDFPHKITFAYIMAKKPFEMIECVCREKNEIPNML